MSYMENVWSIRKKEKLYYILSEEFIPQKISTDILKKTAIVMYLYYAEDVQRYLKYLQEIPSEISVYIITSNKNA